MNQIVEVAQQPIGGKDMLERCGTDETRELDPEGVGATELEQEMMQLHRRRRTWRAAGGAIAGMMAARRAAQ